MGGKEKQDSYNLIPKKYVLVAPDGGWGYMVSVATLIMLSTTTAFVGCFGLLYNDFINEVGMSSASVTLLPGVCYTSMAVGAFFTSPLLTILSMRKLAFIFAILFTLGALGTVVMTSILMFYIFQLMQSTGLGVLYNLSCTVINDYFDKKRMLIMSFVQTATGALTMIAPIFVKWSLDKYGTQGTLLLIGGISLHNLCAVFMMQPVRWHMKKVEALEKPDHKLLIEEKNEVKSVNKSVIKLTDIEGTKSAAVEALDSLLKNKNNRGIRKVLDSVIDTSLCKTFLLSCVSFGPAMCTSADNLFIVILPQYLYSVNWNQELIATAIALYGFGDLVMRIIITLGYKWVVKWGVQLLYICGIVLAIITKFGMLWTSSVTVLMVCFTIMGASHCSIAVLFSMVVSDAVEPEKFTSAMGMLLLFGGILSIILGPAVGAVRDITNSYIAAFYTLTFFYVIVLVLWSIELYVKKNKRQTEMERTKSKTSQSNNVPG